MSIRLNKAIKECNVGLQTAVEFLQKKGFKDVEANLTAKISDEQYELLQKEFVSDKGLRKAADDLLMQQRKAKEEREQKKQKEVMLETTSIQKPKIVGKIDLDGSAAKREAEEKAAAEAAARKKAEEEARQKAEEEAAARQKAAEEAAARQKAEEEAAARQKAAEEAAARQKAEEEAKAAEEASKAEAAQNDATKSAENTPSTDDGVFRLKREDKPAVQFNVVGKVDLSALNQSTRPKKKSKEEKKREREASAQNQNGQQGGERKKRNRIGKERVDINAEARQIQQNPSRKNNNQQQNQQQSGGKKKKGQKQQPVVQQEVSDEEVAKQVRETLARLTSKGSKMGKGAKYRREKRDAIRQGMEEQMENEAAESKVLKLTEFVTANELATMMNIPVTQVIGTCMSIGIMVSINQRLDAETINIVAEEFGFTTEYVSAEVSEAVTEIEDDEEDLVPRAPIVTVMGHVDHGKTSLLDYIRQTNVIAGEAGGITQHIGAYNVKLEDGRHVTFLDTPGHEAFTAMRARGAQVTDIAIIIVAADDDIMPQTKEAIAHAAAANVPIVFAINKIDKPAANPDKIKEGLAAMNYLVEEWGGKYQSQDISAKKGIGVEELLEKVLLEAEMLDLKANPNRKATGSIIESSLDKGRGYVATVMCSNGTLRQGDIMLAGTNFGRVKAMFDERGHRVQEIGPAQAATILGLNGAPTAGDTFHVMDTDQEAREIANKRLQLQREQGLRTQTRLTLDEIGRRIALGDFKELNVIVKGDVDGSIEALKDSFEKLSTEKIQVNVIYKAVGQISESDVTLAAASDAIIVGFQVRPSAQARRLADQEGVDIRLYSVIYDAIEELKDAMEGMLSPEIKEEVTAQVEVRQVYHISKVGTVAGAYVIDGKVSRTNKARVVRDGIVVFTGAINALKRFKDDVKEVTTNFECGISLVNYNDLREGDILETFQEIEVKAKL
ncbi:MAG: translation initiation factor IF-2 [Bacteroidales bacterium]|nr:translation initiation factor IF-2 [Candidatus Physcousia equi]